MQGKIIKGIGGFYTVHNGIETSVVCRAKGIFRNRGEKPLVGDNVEFSLIEEEEGTGRIDKLLPRKNELIRPAVANMDQALILVSAGKPEFHPLLLDNRETAERIAACYQATGYPVLIFSALSGEGVPALREVLKGRTTVLAGASGVGKSTLLNALIPEAGMETGELSERLGRGKHTTRHSEIFFLEKDSFVLDTPGFTSLDTPELDASEAGAYYPEFAEPAKNCRFPDCLHDKEPDCGVKAAVRDGRIAKSRYLSYLRNLEDIRGRRPY